MCEWLQCTTVNPTGNEVLWSFQNKSTLDYLSSSQINLRIKRNTYETEEPAQPLRTLIAPPKDLITTTLTCPRYSSDMWQHRSRRDALHPLPPAHQYLRLLEELALELEEQEGLPLPSSSSSTLEGDSSLYLGNTIELGLIGIGVLLVFRHL